MTNTVRLIHRSESRQDFRHPESSTETLGEFRYGFRNSWRVSLRLSKLLASFATAFETLGEFRYGFRNSWRVSLRLSKLLASFATAFETLGEFRYGFRNSWRVSLRLSKLLASFTTAFETLGEFHYGFRNSWRVSLRLSKLLASFVTLKLAHHRVTTTGSTLNWCKHLCCSSCPNKPENPRNPAFAVNTDSCKAFKSFPNRSIVNYVLVEQAVCSLKSANLLEGHNAIATQNSRRLAKSLARRRRTYRCRICHYVGLDHRYLHRNGQFAGHEPA